MILSVTLPFFALILFGYVAASQGWVPTEAVPPRAVPAFFIFAIRYEADAGRISATILLTTALAFLTFSTRVWMMGIGGSN